MSLADLPLVKLDNFEGPFDLLIELARSEKVDLTAISLARVTEAYLKYLEEVDLPASTQADFLVVAATLLLLKLNQLLPTLTPDEAAEVTQLTERVRIYQLYRAAAFKLKQSWETLVLLPAPAYLQLHHRPPFPELTAESLAEAMHRSITGIRPPANPQRHLRPRGRSLHECLADLRQRLSRLQAFHFHDAVHDEPRDTVAITFLAVLELARSHQVALHQTELFGSLHIAATSPNRNAGNGLIPHS